MFLDIAGDERISAPTRDVIEEWVQRIPGLTKPDPVFLILVDEDVSPEHFVQAMYLPGEDCFFLERRAGSEQEHLRRTDLVDAETVVEVFVRFLEGDDTTSIGTWRHINDSASWCAFPAHVILSRDLAIAVSGTAEQLGIHRQRFIADAIRQCLSARSGC